MAEGGGSALVKGLPLWADILLSGEEGLQTCRLTMNSADEHHSDLAEHSQSMEWDGVPAAKVVICSCFLGIWALVVYTNTTKCQLGCATGAVVTLSAYFAGTTLGIFTLDRVGLQILSQASDNAVERKHASAYTLVCTDGLRAVQAEAPAFCKALMLPTVLCNLQRSYCP